MPNLPVTGNAGIAPPPDAPIETSQPLQSDAQTQHLVDLQTGAVSVRSPRDLARQNERTLAPLKYEGPTKGGIVEAIEAVREGKVDPFFTRQAEAAATAAQTAVVEPDVSEDRQPARSNNDGPTRGIPGTAPTVQRGREALRPSGGFGDSIEAQYYPLNGHELGVVVCGLLDAIEQRIPNDLRFHMAMVYPRAKVTVSVLVEAETAAQGLQIENVFVHDKTPLDVAKRNTDSVIFVVTEQRREFDDTDLSETPPDAMREEVGLTLPRKQMVKTGAGRQMVDRLDF